MRRIGPLLVFLLVILGPCSSAKGQESGLCSTVDFGVRIDHVVIAVDDLRAAGEAYSRLGFTVKPGREHQNGIENLHLKFPSRSELELLAVKAPTDDLARAYVEFLREGEGGAFLALQYMGSLDELMSAARVAGVTPRRFRSPAFDWVSFPDSPDLHHIFFIEYHVPLKDPDSILSHANHAAGIDEVWIEGTEKTQDFLLSLSPKACGSARHPAGFSGQVIGGVLGHLVVVQERTVGHRFRILGVTLRAGPYDGSDVLHSPDATHGIWLRLHFPAGSR
jgi:hypothetical protein